NTTYRHPHPHRRPRPQFSRARARQLEASMTDATEAGDDEWRYEMSEVLERAWGFRVRPGERVKQPGIFYCVTCGVSQPLSVGETARDCIRDATRSEWVWRAGDEK